MFYNYVTRIYILKNIQHMMTICDWYVIIMLVWKLIYTSLIILSVYFSWM